MATDQERLRRRVLDHVQSLGMSGVSRQEAQYGEGPHRIRTIRPRAVLAAHAHIRRCQDSGRHVEKPNVCQNCVKALGGFVEETQIERIDPKSFVAPDTGSDEEQADTPAYTDWENR